MRLALCCGIVFSDDCIALCRLSLFLSLFSFMMLTHSFHLQTTLIMILVKNAIMTNIAGGGRVKLINSICTVVEINFMLYSTEEKRGRGVCVCAVCEYGEITSRICP